MQKNDTTITIQDLKDLAQHMANERDWQQFHSPKNLSTKITIEAGELAEKFVWSNTEQSYEDINQNRQEIEQEAADVLIALLLFCNASHIDITQAVLTKLEEIKAKYPIDKAKGKATKYNKL